MPPRCIVVINDNPVVVRLLKQVLSDDGYQVIGAVGERDGYAAIAREQPDLVVLDCKGSGFDAEWYVLALSWHEPQSHQRYVLPMPFDLDALRALVAQAGGQHT